MDDAARIAEGLSARHRKAWKEAEWCDEYYIVPALFERSVWARSCAMANGLISRDCDGDYSVTWRGDRLIRYLNRPTFWDKVMAALRAHLLSKEPK